LATQYEVDAIRQRIEPQGRVEIEHRGQPLDCLRIGNSIDDRTSADQLVTYEIHLRDEPSRREPGAVCARQKKRA
jgi:hypothetical protein